MTPTRLLVCALVLTSLIPGCLQPVSLVIEDGTTHGVPMLTMPADVEDACARLGLVCETSSREYGSVVMSFVLVEDTPGELTTHGQTHDRLCRPSIWVDPRKPLRIAHELGHVFELEHVDDSNNLMSVAASGDEITDEQLDTVGAAADLLINCR